MRRPLVTTLALVGALSCGGAKPPLDIGVARAHGSDRVVLLDAGATAVDAGFWGPSLLATLQPLTASAVPSRGHLLERVKLRVLGNDPGRTLYESGRGIAEEGALLVAVHESSGEGGANGRAKNDGVIMAMSKLGKGASPTTNDWRYTLVDGDGNVTAEGALGMCEACHRDAPGDHLFRAATATSP